MRLVDEPTAVANGGAVRRRIGGRPAGPPALATLMLALAACTANGRPSLHEVPDRPLLSATAQDRAAIAAALRSDRAAAAREAAALRARTGKTALPPPAWLFEPPAPPVRAAAATGPAAVTPANVEAAIVAERVRSESDDGSLNTFLRQLVRRQPAAALVTEDDPFRPEPTVAEGTAEGAAPTPDSPALDRFLEQLGGRLAVGRAEPAAPAAGSAETAAPPPAPTPPAAAAPAVAPAAAAASAPATAPGPGPRPETVRPETVRPEAARRAVDRPAAPAPAAAVPTAREPPLAILPPPSPGGTLPSAARAELERALAALRASGAGVEVVGHGATPALALERARAVARLVAEIGVPAGGLALRPAGPGERVELHRLARPPS